jgi:hypothetical protein
MGQGYWLSRGWLQWVIGPSSGELFAMSRPFSRFVSHGMSWTYTWSPVASTLKARFSAVTVLQ